LNLFFICYLSRSFNLPVKLWRNHTVHPALPARPPYFEDYPEICENEDVNFQKYPISLYPLGVLSLSGIITTIIINKIQCVIYFITLENILTHFSLIPSLILYNRISLKFLLLTCNFRQNMSSEASICQTLVVAHSYNPSYSGSRDQ
jgi:hypothetical protein